ncbi:MAG TPA: cytochrome c oxidase subunit II [Variovorax sp.]|nr:cytochrome c oxidase subunit II [Variovorax sp.]
MWAHRATLASLAAFAFDAAAGQGALDPAGIQAARIHSLWQITVWVCLAVFTLVLLALMIALVRAARRTRRESPEPARGERHERGASRVVLVASLLSGAALAGLVALDVLTDRALSRLPVHDALHIEMVGAQWWWRTRYADDPAGPGFEVSSDLHVPVGRPVVVTLKSVDVIHSFWVPQLHGKKDMLPGRTTTIQFRADRAGSFRGECAEFCGLQHALMVFNITADPPERYAQWRALQASPASPPELPDALRGQALFLARNCAQCHAVRGTPAGGTLGPDLTHVASRPTIAAGTVANRPDLLAAWIVQPQLLKAGATMPPSALEPEEVRLLVSYLETLK